MYKGIHKYTDRADTYIAKHKIINLKKELGDNFYKRFNILLQLNFKFNYS